MRLVEFHATLYNEQEQQRHNVPLGNSGTTTAILQQMTPATTQLRYLLLLCGMRGVSGIVSEAYPSSYSRNVTGPPPFQPKVGEPSVTSLVDQAG